MAELYLEREGREEEEDKEKISLKVDGAAGRGEAVTAASAPHAPAASYTFDENAPYPAAAKSARSASSADLQSLAKKVSSCVACSLCKTRKQTVFADGSPDAKIMFIGEAPGADEDAQGVPFVGRAGQLLTRMIEDGMGLPRKSVYIANVLKCRPPGNRDPLPEELQACSQYLDRQIETINAPVIVTLGRVSMGKFLPLAKISLVHGKPFWVAQRLIVPMYHPAAALHQPSLKNIVIEDFRTLPVEIARAREAGRLNTHNQVSIPLEIPKADEPPEQLSLF